MTCKDCVHKEACGEFTPTDLDQDVFDYCREGRTDEIPDIEERCGCFKNKADFVEVVRCKDCKHYDGGRFCYYSENTVLDNDYCSYGKRIDT